MTTRLAPCRTLAVPFCVLALAACSFTQPAPVKQTYLLEPRAPAAQAPASARPSLRVGAINVATPFRGRSLVYRSTDLRYESDFYNEYFVSPASMLTEAVTAWFARMQLFPMVRPGQPREAEYVLDGFFSELYGDLRETAKPAAVVTAKFFLTDEATGAVVWQRELRQRVAITRGDADSVASGLNDALTGVLSELGQALGDAKLPAH